MYDSKAGNWASHAGRRYWRDFYLVGKIRMGCWIVMVLFFVVRKGLWDVGGFREGGERAGLWDLASAGERREIFFGGDGVDVLERS